ncbi:hypothetical protein [Dietzia sp. WMMA184]|uniref:hypothetical protein n=1 Tax=Dietzia sp. WMMA184 TaxID=2039808 RepID=UPI00117839E1|nr:hypothetical protein [Dietzia sp. WMMA184]
MSTFERGAAAIEELITRSTDNSLNEATTRRRIIDVLLKDVFAWPDDQVICEEHVDGDYLDYSLGSPQRRAILEAKKSGAIFEAPAGIDSGWHSIATFREHTNANSAAIDQVLQYCQKAGVGVALLSNGHQFLAFLGSRSDGRKPTTGKALYYASLADVSRDFHSLWDMLSPEGMTDGTLSRRLSGKSSATPPPLPLSSRIHSYPGYRIGTGMETDLRILGDLFIQDVAREESITDNFLLECYCSSGALSQYATVSKEILRTRYYALSLQVNTESARSRTGPSSDLVEDVIAGAITRRPIILLGDVGVGKSIFLKHLFRIESKDLLDKTTIFYVDFLKHAGLIEDVADQIVKVIDATLEETYGINTGDRQFVRAVYNKEINAFKRGIYGQLEESDPSEYRRREIEMLSGHLSNTYEHARRSLSHLQASRSLSFVIALDNVDQHQPSFQEQIFIVGQSLAETWPCAVFMSLRPDTFHESRKTGALAAYQPRVFTVSPPRSDQVIVKRLEFAKKELQKFGRLPGFPSNLTLDSTSLVIYIDVLISAFKNNDKLVELVDNLSSGNTRRALDFVSTFVGSGYVQTSRILEAHKTGRPYIIPLHEFIRAILYGDHRYYDPNTSPVPNLFALSSNSTKEHFLLPILLALVQAAGGRASAGFIELRECANLLQSLGFTLDQIDHHLQRATRHGLVERTDHGDAGTQVRITAAGGYLYQELITSFPYLDAIVVDTPILDVDARGLIRDVHDIGDRLDRAESFVEYLEKCWAFEGQSVPFDWPSISEHAKATLEDVRRRANRPAARTNKIGK